MEKRFFLSLALLTFFIGSPMFGQGKEGVKSTGGASAVAAETRRFSANSVEAASTPVGLEDCITCHVDQSARLGCDNMDWLVHNRKGYVNQQTFELAETTYLGTVCDGSFSSATTTHLKKDKVKKNRYERDCTDKVDNDKDGLIDCDDPDCSGYFTCRCICPLYFDPVCGVDGKTYGNSCEASCAGVKIAYHGACGSPTTCGGIASLECRAGFVCDMRDFKCNTSDLGGICVPRPEACPKIWDPVCACNGVTYANNCERLRAGAVFASNGPCTCGCPEIHDPACGVDGKTYDNECLAKCAGVAVQYKGMCGKMCGGIAGFPCPDGETCNYIDPTCSISDLAGTCVPKGDVCIMIYAPVCGCDGKTYSNDCFRIMAGATLAHKGECKATCDDGTIPLCMMAVPNCPPGTVLAIQRNCYVCADPLTCRPML